MKRFFTFVLATIAFVACTQNDVEELSNDRLGMPETLNVGFEGGDTRIQLNDIRKTIWNAGDEVSVFYRSYENMRWAFQGETGDRTGELKLVEGEGGEQTMDKTVVVYPYNENYHIDLSDGGVEASLAGVQQYMERSYGEGGNIMVAESSFTQFILRSVVGWLRFELTGEEKSVSSITVRGNNDEQVAGLIYINAEDASITLASSNITTDEDGEVSGSLIFDNSILTEVILDCGEGVALGSEPTEFYVAVLPQTFENGLSVDVAYTDGEILSRSCDYLELERNHIVPIALEAGEEEEPIYDTWGIVGTFNNWNSPDITMQYIAEENMIVAYGVELEAGAMFKLRMNETWDYNYGGVIDDPLTVNTSYGVTSGGSNFTVSEDGIYDIYLDWDTMLMWFMEAGVVPDTSFTLGICGTFTDWGGIPDIEMTYDETNDIYYALGIDIEENGRFKIRSNNSWSAEYNIGIADSSKYIDANSYKELTNYTQASTHDICVANAGTYDIYFDMNSMTIWFMVSGVDRSTATEDLPDGWDGVTTSEIRYTSTDGNIVQPYNQTAGFADATGAYLEILSNEYVDGVGTITFAGELAMIVYYAFQNCDSLTSVTIPDSVTTIVHSAFSDCDGLTSVTMPDNSVKYIGENTFFSCDNLTDVNLPEGLLSLGSFAFQNCTSLTSIKLPDSLEEIGTCPFHGCTRIGKFEGKFATEDGRAIIYNNTLLNYACTSGSEYDVPEGVTAIGDYAFYGANLSNVTISEGVTSILTAAFAYVNIESITLPESLEYIDDAAFQSCESLTEIVIPDNVEIIENYAFTYCSSLESITIGSSVGIIGIESFGGCHNVSTIYSKATTPPTLSDGTFYGLPWDSCKIYVPVDSFNAYLSNEYWNEFADYIVGYNYETDEEVELLHSYISLSFEGLTESTDPAYQYAPLFYCNIGKDVTAIRYIIQEGFVDNIEDYASLIDNSSLGYVTGGTTEFAFSSAVATGRYTLIAMTYTGEVEDKIHGSMKSVKFMIQANDSDEAPYLAVELYAGAVADLIGDPSYEAYYPSTDYMGLVIGSTETDLIESARVAFILKNHETEGLTPAECLEILNTYQTYNAMSWFNFINPIQVTGADYVCNVLEVTTIFGTKHYFHYDYKVPTGESSDLGIL